MLRGISQPLKEFFQIIQRRLFYDILKHLSYRGMNNLLKLAAFMSRAVSQAVETDILDHLLRMVAKDSINVLMFIQELVEKARQIPMDKKKMTQEGVEQKRSSSSDGSWEVDRFSTSSKEIMLRVMRTFKLETFSYRHALD